MAKSDYLIVTDEPCLECGTEGTVLFLLGYSLESDTLGLCLGCAHEVLALAEAEPPHAT